MHVVAVVLETYLNHSVILACVTAGRMHYFWQWSSYEQEFTETINFDWS